MASGGSPSPLTGASDTRPGGAKAPEKRSGATVVLAAIAIGCGLAAVYCARLGGRDNLLTCALPAALAAIGFGFSTRLADHWRKNLALAVGSSLGALWLANAVVAVVLPRVAPPATREEAARRAGAPFDPRSMREVLADLQTAGIEAYPTVYVGNWWGRRPIFRDSLYPLGSISGVVSVMCNEGHYVLYRTDEFGFPNPSGAWNPPTAELALVGDSYTQGWCVRPAAAFANRIRAEHPATVVAGHGASGPLTQLGQMREYLARVRPRRVVWFYFEGNDLSDLRRELKHAILPRYLEPGFTQDLAGRQGAIDAALKDFAATADSLSARWEATVAAKAALPRTLTQRAWALVRLAHLRSLVGRLTQAPQGPACCEYDVYRRVVAAAKATVEGWGGQLVVVYLPSEPRLSGHRRFAGDEAAGDSVVRILSSAGIPLLDLRDSLPRFGTANELNAFSNAHYTERGHDAVAQLVLAYLARLGTR